MVRLYRKIVCSPPFNHYRANCGYCFGKDLTRKNGPCTAWNECWEGEKGGGAVASFSAVFCLTRPLNAIVMRCSVSPRGSGYRCGFPVIRPPVPVPAEPPQPSGGSRRSGTLSSSIVVKTQPKPSCDGKLFCKLTFRVHEQCGTYVYLLNNAKRDLLQDYSIDFLKVYRDCFMCMEN